MTAKRWKTRIRQQLRALGTTEPAYDSVIAALAYWRELGLTPSSYKKMSGEGPKKEKPAGLAATLQSLES